MKKICMANRNCQAVLAEVSILKLLDHPNIIRIFDVYQEKGCLFIVY
jgi:hypothetical protein